MKNRVLRSALAVILVIAMVLTMAACSDTTEDVVTTTTPAATAAPAATETPVAPTEAPVVTTAPTVAPTTSAEQDTIADDFGITLTAVDGTYGTDAKNADGDKIKDEEKYNKVIDKPYGYYLLSIDEDLINDQDYDITITYGNVNIYSNVDGKQWIGGTTTYTSNTDVLAAEGAGATFAFSDYDGDSTAATGYIYFVDEDEIYILFKEAGEYELELEVVIEDKYQDYGAWDNDDRDEFETTLTSVLTIAKQSVAISFDPIVVKVDEDSELIVDDATTAKVDSPTTGTAAHYFENGEVVVLDGNGTSTFGTSYGTFAPSKTILPNGYSYEFALDYTEETAVGTYAVSVAIVQGGDEVDLDDINEELPNHIITSVADAEIYVVSSYDWNEIRDVVTSISEIEAYVVYAQVAYGTDPTTAVDAVTIQSSSFTEKENKDYLEFIFFDDLDWSDDTYDAYDDLQVYILNYLKANDYDLETSSITSITNSISDYKGWFDSNYEVQLTLALARYNALSAEQQAWFQTGTVSTAGTAGTITVNSSTAAIDNWFAAGLSDDADYATDAIAYYEFMEIAEDAADLKIVLDAFDDYVDDAELVEYVTFDTTDTTKITGYYTSNSSAITAFNLVDAYWNALSEDDQDDITDAGSEWYGYYDTAKDAFDAAEVTAVQELIVGAYNAYVKAVDNGAKVIYQYVATEKDTSSNLVDSFTTWAYINSSEVISLTSQAQAAYDALTDDQQKILDVRTSSTTGYTQIVKNTTYAADSTTVYAVQPNETEAYLPTFKDVLDQLSDMNEMVETMITISEYVNIADYSTDGVVYTRLNALVYGTGYAAYDDGEVTAATDLQGMFFAVYGTASADGLGDYGTDANNKPNSSANDTNYYDYRFAMQDIIDAPTRNYDAIIAEYQAWIDFVLYLEDYKADLVDAFKDGVADAIAELDTEDYDASVLSVASSMSNGIAKAVIAAIEGEKEDTTEPTTSVSAFSAQTLSGVTTGFIVKAGFVEDFESIEEIMEELEDFCDIEDVIDSYIDSIKE
ncbi:MAG: hypothetical protein R3Y45_02775 [Bacillota bacterium]